VKVGERMDITELGRQIIAMTDTLYRVSASLLRSEHDREDAVQSAIEIAFRRAGSLRDADKLRPWMIRILTNECFAIMRRAKREVPAEVLPASAAPEELSDLRQAVDTLEPGLRLPVLLHYMEGFSTKEIAQAMHLPQGTVLSRMNKARRLLRNMLEEE